MDTITGTVSKTDHNRLSIAEQEGWLNISKFAKPTPAMPQVGERVRIGLDKSGFVRAIEPIAEAPTKVAPAPIAVRQAAPAVVATPAASATEVAGTAPDRDRLIVRQTCVKAAAEVAAGYPKTGAFLDAATLAGIALQIAEQFEAWVYRAAE